MVEMSSLHEESNAQLARTPIVRVIDDDDKVRRSWQFVLEGEGWQVQAYESAVRFLKEDDPQVPGCIVCDVRMPEMSGIELQTEMKRAGNRMPLVLISAHADLVMAVKAVKDGAYDFLLKPVETEHLIQTVSEALELDQTRREENAEVDRVRRSWDLLSAREKEVARGVADGKLNKQIAYDLNISEKIRNCAPQFVVPQIGHSVGCRYYATVAYYRKTRKGAKQKRDRCGLRRFFQTK